MICRKRIHVFLFAVFLVGYLGIEMRYSNNIETHKDGERSLQEQFRKIQEYVYVSNDTTTTLVKDCNSSRREKENSIHDMDEKYNNDIVEGSNLEVNIHELSTLNSAEQRQYKSNIDTEINKGESNLGIQNSIQERRNILLDMIRDYDNAYIARHTNSNEGLNGIDTENVDGIAINVLAVKNISQLNHTKAIKHSELQTLRTNRTHALNRNKTLSRHHHHHRYTKHYPHHVDQCSRYEEELTFNHTIFRNVFGGKNSAAATPHLVCLVTQITHSRLYMLKRVAQHWKGCISAVIYVDEASFSISMTSVQSWLEGNRRSNIAIHYMLKKGEYYPVNKLRNIAQFEAPSEYIILIDVDNVPNKRLERYINYHINSGFFDSEKNKTLIVPALEMHKTGVAYPSTKEKLLNLMKEGIIDIFHINEFSPAHQPTNFPKWKRAQSPYKVQYSSQFEPYQVIKKAYNPKYDERFLQRFYNKAVQISELHARGFEFWVMPEGYLVHMPHKYEQKKSDSIFECAHKIWKRVQHGHAKLKARLRNETIIETDLQMGK